jgi:hypothetical protein
VDERSDGRAALRQLVVAPHGRVSAQDHARGAALLCDRDGRVRDLQPLVLAPPEHDDLGAMVEQLDDVVGLDARPVEVEAVLSTHPQVRDVVVVGVPDEVMGEVGVACVVPTAPDHPPDLEGLRAVAARALASFKLPDRVELVDALPLTTGDKIDRRALRRRLGG